MAAQAIGAAKRVARPQRGGQQEAVEERRTPSLLQVFVEDVGRVGEEIGPEEQRAGREEQLPRVVLNLAPRVAPGEVAVRLGEAAPLAMIRAVLDDSITSRLQREIVETRGLAYSIRAGMELFCDAGTFDIDASCTPAKVLSVVDAVLALLRELTQRPVPQDELNRVLARRRIALDFHADDLNTLVNCLGAMELFRPPETFEENLAALERVTPAHLLDVARRTFTQDALHLCAVGPRVGRLKKQLFLAAEAFYFRNILGNSLLLGDTGDGHFCLLVAEHWYRWLLGKEGFFSLPIFWPETSALAWSDLLLGFGLPHALFRLMGMDPYTAYKSTLIGLHAAGALGTFFLLRKGFELRCAAAFIGAVLAGSSQMIVPSCHTQLYACAFLPFIAMALLAFFRNMDDAP